jgi:hypothetical protein
MDATDSLSDRVFVSPTFEKFVLRYFTETGDVFPDMGALRDLARHGCASGMFAPYYSDCMALLKHYSRDIMGAFNDMAEAYGMTQAALIGQCLGPNVDADLIDNDGEISGEVACAIVWAVAENVAREYVDEH